MGRPIRFVDTEWGRIAVSTVGSGPPLLFDPGWIGHLDVLWAHDGYRSMVERLATTRRVICFDPPGTGRSERGTRTRSIDDEVALVRSVLATVDGPPTAVFASSIAASTAVRLAARYPSEVGRMVLYGGALRGRDLASPDARNAMLTLVRAHWGLGSRAMADIFVPDAGPADRDWFAGWQRSSTDGEAAAARLALYYESDVSDDASMVRAPTLVVHRTGDRAVRVDLGAAMASAIPGATFEAVTGTAHACFMGDWVHIADVAAPFLEPPRASLLPKGPYGEFTARETDVAELTTLGLSNAGIGDRLGISPRTVETHLRSIRQKLGVGTRAEVAAWMARRADIG